MVINISRTYRKLGLLIVLLLFIQQRVAAQHVKQLKVGDTIPDVEIANLIREQPQVIKSSQLYSKGLLIINFWASWCVPCVKEMKTLAEETEKYKDRLNVLSVGYENEKIVKSFLAAHPDLANSGLWVTSNDKAWNSLFFHQALPHNIWIDKKGIVRSITGGEEITDQNISKFLRDSISIMYQKNEAPFDMYKPMHIPDSLIEFRSIFNKNLPGVSLSGNVRDGHNWGFPNMKRYFEFNTLITHLFWNAYDLQGYCGEKTLGYLIEVHTSDSSKYFWPGAAVPKEMWHGISRDRWGRENAYSYELRTAHPTPDSLFFKRIINDLEFNLNVKTWRELREKTCVVVTTRDTNKFQKGILNKPGTYNIVGSKLIIDNVPLDFFLHWLARYTYSARAQRVFPYINRTNLQGPYSFTIDLGPDKQLYTSQDHIEKCLADQIGLVFETKKELYPIVIIKDL